MTDYDISLGIEGSVENITPSLCGGRQFGRRFNKKDYPLLGDSEDDARHDDSKTIHLSPLGRERLPKKLSTSVSAIRDLCYDPKTGKWHWPKNGADLVHPHIYLGDASTALCIGQLREMGVTAVLNAAQGSMADWSYVNTKAIYYTGVGIQFLGVPAIDLKWYPICNHFQEASNFIDEVIQSKGIVLVHCVQGISRSATLVLAYLIMKRKMTIQQAMEAVRSKRSIAPNEGFVQQLIELNDHVHALGPRS